MDCSPPGSYVHGISQARILEWGAVPFSRGSSPPGLLHYRQILYQLSHQESPKKSFPDIRVSEFHLNKKIFCGKDNR